MQLSRRVTCNAQRIIPLAIVGVLGSVALTHPNEGWSSAAVSVTALASLGMTVGALFGSPKRRPFRGGFAVCCGGYFLLFWFAYGSASRQAAPNPYFEATATTKSLDFLHDRLFPDSSVKLLTGEYSFGSSGFGGGGFGSGGGVFGGGGAFEVAADGERSSSTSDREDSHSPPSVRLAQAMTGPPVQTPANPTPLAAQLQSDSDTAQYFLAIGQCLWALILGYLGGLFAQFLARRQVASCGPAKSPAPAASEASPV